MNNEKNIEEVDLSPENVGDITPNEYDKDGDGIDDKTEQEVEPYMDVDAEKPPMYDVPKKEFWDTAFGRTLKGRNKTGKIVYTGLAGVGSTLLPEPFGGWLQQGANALIQTQTGVGMDVLLDLNMTQLIVMAVGFIVAWALPSIVPAIKEKQAWKVIEGRLDNVTDEVVKAVDEDSENGKKISRNELKAIIASALKNDDT